MMEYLENHRGSRSVLDTRGKSLSLPEIPSTGDLLSSQQFGSSFSLTMISSVSPVLASFASTLRSRLDLVFEHLALLHQVIVMRRSRRRAQFSGADRCFWILLSALWDRWPTSLMIAQPATVLRWRREGGWRGWRRAGLGGRRWTPNWSV
jgi:hypothetical protein